MTLFDRLEKAYEKDADESLPMEVAAIWGAFLHEGLMDSLSNPRDKAILGNWKLGCIELMDEATRWLPEVWDELYRQWDANDSCCGVFEYEVVAILGSYLGDHLLLREGALPPDREVKAVIQTLVYSFLEQGVRKAS